jgi:hypothetical protein
MDKETLAVPTEVCVFQKLNALMTVQELLDG